MKTNIPKRKLWSGCSRRGADMGRCSIIPLDTPVGVKLRMEKLRWVGDYDQEGAYWGNSGGTDIYWAYGFSPTKEINIFTRAASRDEAKAFVCEAVFKKLAVSDDIENACEFVNFLR